MTQYRRTFLMILGLSAAFGMKCRCTDAQSVPTKENIEALRYEDNDPPPPKIRQDDIDKVRRAFLSALLGKDAAERYATLDGAAKIRTMQQAAMAWEFREPEQSKESVKRAQKSSQKQMRQMMWTWHLTADSLGSDPRYVNDLLGVLDDASIRSTRIVQDFFTAHPGEVEQLTPLDLLNLYARVSAAYLSRTGANALLIYTADVITDHASFRNTMGMTFSNDQEMEQFFDSHKSEVELVEGIRDQLLKFCLGLLRPETEKRWGDPKLLDRVYNTGGGYFPSAEDSFKKNGRDNIDLILGPRALKQFDAGVDPVYGSASPSLEEKLANQHRLFDVAEVIGKLHGLAPDFQRAQIAFGVSP